MTDAGRVPNPTFNQPGRPPTLTPVAPLPAQLVVRRRAAIRDTVIGLAWAAGWVALIVTAAIAGGWQLSAGVLFLALLAVAAVLIADVVLWAVRRNGW